MENHLKPIYTALCYNKIIITIVMNIGTAEHGCPVPLCVCKSNTTARCMNHEKDLDYIPQLPSSVRTLDFVNNYLPHINRQTDEIYFEALSH
jgi:hypothetical protein